MTIQELSKAALGYFTRNKRTTGDYFFHLFDNIPEWVSKMVRDAHGDMLPNDYTYEVIREALLEFSESDDPELSISNIEADYGNYALIQWLGSNSNRPSFVDEAVGEFGHSDGGILGDIMRGQLQEKATIYNSVLSSLSEQVS